MIPIQVSKIYELLEELICTVNLIISKHDHPIEIWQYLLQCEGKLKEIKDITKKQIAKQLHDAKRILEADKDKE